MAHIDLAGQRFAGLSVLRRVTPPGAEVSYLCRCDCGTEKVIRAANLRNGSTLSCGCRKRGCKANLKHGLSTDPVHRLWRKMKERCGSPNSADYPTYGGRGIRVCAEWASGFVAFYEWCGAHGWAPGLFIDRIDSNGDYSPGNCRFLTPQESARNRRGVKLTWPLVRAVRIAFQMGSVDLKKAAENLGVSLSHARRIINNENWKEVFA